MKQTTWPGRMAAGAPGAAMRPGPQPPEEGANAVMPWAPNAPAGGRLAADPDALLRVPAIAGWSPGYVARRPRDARTGVRNGAWSDLMDTAAAGLTVEIGTGTQ